MKREATINRDTIRLEEIETKLREVLAPRNPDLRDSDSEGSANRGGPMLAACPACGQAGAHECPVHGQVVVPVSILQLRTREQQREALGVLFQPVVAKKQRRIWGVVVGWLRRVQRGLEILSREMDSD